ncbi:hypothetical protein SAMN05216191_1252 [Paenibacillus jilunlii]|uniref:Uncharacterized protein n=1 Tax=Paenibacillus jilunlii TaxID=682956 RepID=A0A1G9Y4L2_9BACL|nr:hypothetical protein AML91_07125 [Paenibacillus jilunlii]SDN03958.1 hypothetical protein SAMN05216191_1252 [Paenibacillus jilunlii]
MVVSQSREYPTFLLPARLQILVHNLLYAIGLCRNNGKTAVVGAPEVGLCRNNGKTAVVGAPWVGLCRNNGGTAVVGAQREGLLAPRRLVCPETTAELPLFSPPWQEQKDSSRKVVCSPVKIVRNCLTALPEGHSGLSPGRKVF